MKKFFIKDDDGKKYEVEEVEEVKDEDIETESMKEIEEVKDEDVLTSDEIRALKELAKVSPKLISMCQTTDEEIDEEETETFTDEEEEEEKEETILKTDSIKSSAASLEKRQKVDDSIEEDRISDAWSKRFQNCGR